VRLRSWLRVDARLNRGRYFAWGVILFAVKSNIDRVLTREIFHWTWEPWSYLLPVTGVPGKWSALEVYGWLLLISLPFIAVGVFLTLRRLRDAGLPLVLVSLIFLPYVKLLLFLFLSVAPSREERVVSPRWPVHRNPWLPKSAFGNALFGILVTMLFAVALVAFGTKVLGSYGWGLFVGLPFLQGLATVVFASRLEPLKKGQAIGLANLSILVTGGVLIAIAIEGLICLAMAIPLAVPLASLGGYVGYLIQRRRPPLRPIYAGGLCLLMPLLMGGERVAAPDPPVYAVTTRVDVAASPAAVWKQVVEFSEIPPPTELLFRAGIAYPMRARIDGRGPGAIRYCEFSTGPFVEPIRTWDEPRLLAFDVTENPAPMEEWTPYRRIEPPHLRKFLVSRRGQFRLTALPGGGTRLEGTTWYRHSLWPAGYWKLWSDFTIHRIHRRVLDHIRVEAERHS